MGRTTWQQQADRLAALALDEGKPTAWFERRPGRRGDGRRLYAAADTGANPLPWDTDAPRAELVDWAEGRHLRGDGRGAIVVGCGLGQNSEYIAGLGYDTVAFDISATAIRVVRDRHPDSSVDYVAADLLDLPAEWERAFDLVVEVYTVQALPDPPRSQAIANVSRLVARAAPWSWWPPPGTPTSPRPRGRRGR